MVSRLRMTGVVSSLTGYLTTCMDTYWTLHNVSGSGSASVVIWSVEIMKRTLLRQVKAANLQFSYNVKNYHLGDETGYY